MAAAVYSGGSSGTLAELLKEQYTDETIAIMGYKDHPLLGMLSKDQNLGGLYYDLPIVYGHARRSAAFATALAQRSVSKHKEFHITTVNDYTVAEIDRKTRLMIKQGNTSYVDAVKRAVDEAVYTQTKGLAEACYGASSGSIGAIPASGGITGDVVTLAEINDIVHFWVGQRVDAYTALSGGSSHGTQEVIAVDRDLGKVTFDSIGSFAASDYLFNEGDRGLRMSGLADWVPQTAPGATTFFGVDRSVDTVWLGGVRVSLSGIPIEEGVQRLIQQVCRNGGRPTVVLLNDARYTDFSIALGSKVVRDIVKSTVADIAYDAIMVHGPKGIVPVVGDCECPYGLAYCLTLDDWTLRSVNMAPHIFDADNDQELLRYASSDSYELRVGYYAQLMCQAPGRSGVGIF